MNKNKENYVLLLDLEYRTRKENGELLPEIVLFVRGRDKKRRLFFIRDFYPYFYSKIPENNLKQLIRESKLFSQWFRGYKKIKKTLYEGGEEAELLLIEGKRPWEVPKIRELFKKNGFDVFEADIPFTHRFLFDMGIFGLGEIKFSHEIPEKKGMTSVTRISPTTSDQDYKLKIASMDIEISINEDPDRKTESLSSVIREGSQRITAISFWYGYEMDRGTGKVFVLSQDNDEEEKKMLIGAFNYLWDEIDPDILITYNGDGFDIPYLLKRMERLGIDPRIMTPERIFLPRKNNFTRGWSLPGIIFYDMLLSSKKVQTEDGSRSLDSVARAVLNEGKLLLDISHGEIWKKSIIDKNAYEKFSNYALKDAELTYLLWFKLNLPEWVEVIRITGSPPREAMFYTARQAGEFLLFRIMTQAGVLIPSAPGKEGKKQREKIHKAAKGGLVFEPKKEIATAVIISDFTSMYPSIIIAHNVGAESFKGLDSSTDPRDRFREYPKTTMALMQEMIFSKRIEAKKMIQLAEEKRETERLERLKAYSAALKIVANSTFGSYNFLGSRLYNSDIAGAITEIGRLYLKELEKKVFEFKQGYEVIYGDTDSVFIQTPLENKITRLWETGPHKREIIFQEIPEILELLSFLRNSLPSQMKLEFQDMAFRILFHKGTKKRYTYASVISKKIVIVGFEAIRSDWSPFSREAQKLSIEVILESGDLDLAKEKVKLFISRIFELDEEELKRVITVLGPIRKPPNEYDSITPAIAAFLHYCSVKNKDPNVIWKEFDYFPYVIIKGKGLIRERARHPSFVRKEDIDFEYYIREAIRAVNRFNVDLKENEIFKNKKINLEDFLFD